MLRVIILGGPGSGKGTQSNYLAQSLNLPVISTGNILRQGIELGDELGLQAKKYVEQGELVPDRMMIEFIKRRLQNDDVTEGWILEGYPRTAFQAEELDFLLEDELGQKLDYAVYLEVIKETMIKRSLARGELDDRPEILETRIELFNQRTTPILEYYQYKHSLITVSGEETPELVSNTIYQQIKQ